MSRLYEQSERPYGIISFLTVFVLITAMLYLIIFWTKGVVSIVDLSTCAFVGLLMAICYTLTKITWTDPKELIEGHRMPDW